MPMSPLHGAASSKGVDLFKGQPRHTGRPTQPLESFPGTITRHL